VLRRAGVEFKEVYSSYRQNEPVLRGISLVAEAGQMSALVGPSGGGKSTILHSILRLYEPQSGAIEIDGQNIADVTRHSLLQQIAYVGQDVFLFHGTIRD